MLARSILTAISTALVLSASSVNAQMITLTSEDETIKLQGKLVGFDGTNYTIETALGTMVVSSEKLACAGDECPYIKPPTSEFTIAGSKAMSEMLVPALLKAYSLDLDASHKLAEADTGLPLHILTDNEQDDIAMVQVASSSSSTGLIDLLQGDASVALSSRPARATEIDAFTKSDLGEITSDSQEHVVALDGLVIVTAPGNPVDVISEIDAARVFSGNVTNWSELGGPDAPISLYVRDDTSATAELFEAAIMAPQALEVSGLATTMESDAAVAEAVAGDPTGIGFTSFARSADAVPMAIEGTCGLQTPANEFTIKTEEYPLTRRLYMYTSAEEAPLYASEFVAFATSAEAQKAVIASGFVNQDITSVAIKDQGLRFASAIVANQNVSAFPQLQQMVRDMLGAERLSATLRFRQGSSLLDSRGSVDVQRLAEILSDSKYNGKVVQLVGFTDSVGDPTNNRSLSRQRANQVREALLAVKPELGDNVFLEPIGYGEISPLGCNESVEGQRINRRVEVWVKNR